jgi:hypothetical protein
MYYAQKPLKETLRSERPQPANWFGILPETEPLDVVTLEYMWNM